MVSNKWCLLALVISLGFWTSCQQEQKKQEATTTPAAQGENYAAPKPPANITGEEAKINYVFTHFWDNFNFQDTAKILNTGYGEQAIVDYIGHFPLVKTDTLREGIEQVFDAAKIEPSVFNFFKFQFENYLAHPNSPMRSDQYYETVLNYLIGSEKVSADEKTKYQTLLPILQKNKPGTTATDFTYTTATGTNGTLKTLEAPFTMLFFYEPGCSSCEEAIAEMKSNPGLNSVIENGGLKILAIYPDGNEEIWKDYQNQIPNNWINAIDKDQVIVTKNLYMIKATPTIYLLDKDKKVILKDSYLPQVYGYFQSL